VQAKTETHCDAVTVEAERVKGFDSFPQVRAHVAWNGGPGNDEEGSIVACRAPKVDSPLGTPVAAAQSDTFEFVVVAGGVVANTA
jgi:hypothetical protein